MMRKLTVPGPQTFSLDLFCMLSVLTQVERLEFGPTVHEMCALVGLVLISFS